jgi:acetyl esterase/lipase
MRSWIIGAHLVAWIALGVVTTYLLVNEVTRPDIPAGVVAYTDIVYRTVEGRRSELDVYVDHGPAPAGGRPVILAIHGGSWKGGTKNGYGRSLAPLVKQGFVVISVDYQLAKPAHPGWPGNIEDVRESVRWVRRHADEFGINPDRIVAMGASAGGHLANLLGTNALGAEADTRVSAVVSLYGPTDLVALLSALGAESPLKLMLGKSLADDRGLYEQASPISHVSGDDAPTLLIHGGLDEYVPLSQSTGLADRLKQAGVRSQLIVVKEFGHSFSLDMPGQELVSKMLTFLNECWRADRFASSRSISPAQF